MLLSVEKISLHVALPMAHLLQLPKLLDLGLDLVFVSQLRQRFLETVFGVRRKQRGDSGMKTTAKEQKKQNKCCHHN
jgi:hypothetical protein